MPLVLLARPSNFSYPIRMMRLLAVCSFVCFLGCSESAPPPTPAGVLTPEFNQIKGLWFDIQHLPHELQKDCRDTATLLRQPSESPTELEFIFECRQPDELWYSVEGHASPHEQDAKLLDFRFENGLVDEAVSLRYWVFDADPEFSQWMVVGYPSENWLWFLSRSTTLDSAIIEETIDKLVEAGHYTRSNLESQLIQTDQSYGTK